MYRAELRMVVLLTDRSRGQRRAKDKLCFQWRTPSRPPRPKLVAARGPSVKMASMFRLTRQFRPIQLTSVRYNSTRPPPPPTVTHTTLHGEKSIPTADQTTAHVPAPPGPAEDRAPVAADIVSGAPEDLHRRTVRIYRPAKSAMQSGLHGNLYWRLDWDVRNDDNRWEHPVMYWAARSLPYCLSVNGIVGITCKGREWRLIRRRTRLCLLRSKDGSITFKNRIIDNSNQRLMPRISITVPPRFSIFCLILAPSKLKVIITK